MARRIRVDGRSYPASPRSVTRSGRAALAVAAFGQGYAGLMIVLAHGAYEHLWLSITGWLLLTKVAGIVFRWAALGEGTLPGRLAAPLYAAVVAVNLVVPWAAGPDGRLTSTAWNWGAGAIVLLVLGIYRPGAEVLAFAAVHAGAALAWAAVPGRTDPLDPVNLLLLVSGCVLPPIAALQFTGFYLDMLRRREDAARQADELRAQAEAEEAVRGDVQERIGRLRREARPVLRAVADGAALPLPPDQVAVARRVAERLRAELVEGREVDWLLRAQVEGVGRPGEVDVQVVTGLGASRLIADDARYAVAGLVGLLLRHPGWERITLSLAGAPDNSLTLALVASGRPVRRALYDPAVRAAAAGLPGSCSAVDERTLVVEARLTAAPEPADAAETVTT